jgi:alpha-L-rhamnosidase
VFEKKTYKTMKIKLLALFFFLNFQLNAQKQISTAKPWAYWWWLGSAANKADVSSNLQDFAKAGFGGLHIIPIYGVKGEEARFLPHLSSQWFEILDFTVQEANRLGLGIDMTLGTGWPLGGAHVADADAAQSFKIAKNISNIALSPTPNPQTTEGGMQLNMLPTKQKVKRAAPGGEGWVVDHFNTAAIQRYLHPYDSAFSAKNYGVRAFYNDSYEVYGANWSPVFLDRFKTLRGYDLANHLDILALDTAKTEKERRIWADYHETLSDIMLEDFTKNVNAFSHKHGKIFRNEAHGSPANILDLYAASDVPESEFFGSKPYNIPLYRQDPDYDPRRFGKPGEIVLKFASSAAHITGKKLVTSETATWLGNHFKVSLRQVKPIIDESFIGGINHIFYHGVPYSPPSAKWPGWLFYASTNFNQQSHFWEHLPQLNGYIERCQDLLQKSKPDNDILLYFPLVDMWHGVGTKSKTFALDVHNILSDGTLNSPFGVLAFDLKEKGYAFDFVSDRQLQNAKADSTSGQQSAVGNQQSVVSNELSAVSNPKSLITEGGAKYRAVIVPALDYMPIATLQALDRLQNAGVMVLFMDKLPRSVNGFNNYQKRESAFKGLLKHFVAYKKGYSQVLDNHAVRVEKDLVAKGLQFTRKKTENGTLYFVVNHEQKFENGTIQLQAMGNSVIVYDPLKEVQKSILPKKISENTLEIPLRIASGESRFILVNTEQSRANSIINASQYAIRNTPYEKILRGVWTVDFLKGEPFLPKSFKTEELKSWTEFGDSTHQYFCGKARYSIDFQLDKKEQAQNITLDLGDVRESGEVKLNGKSLGVLWSLPYRVALPKGLLKNKNHLEVEVINNSANRIRYVDKQGENWRKFYDINIVDINYKPFNAANWQVMESGLMSPVKLIFSLDSH